MDFLLTDEQRALAQVTGDFLARHSPEAEVRRLMAEPAGHDPAVWRRMADEIGLQGLLVPESYGGAGAGYVELGLVLEEMGRALLCAPYLSTAALAVTVLLRCPDEPARAEHLPRIAAGESIATVVIAPGSVRAERTDAGWVLTGGAEPVLDGHLADLLLVAAGTADGPALFAVTATPDADPVAPDAGPMRELLTSMDSTRRLARLRFAATPARSLADAGQAGPVLAVLADVAAAALASEQVGVAARALEMAVDHARTRYQFGRPIGSFQAVKHRCADMLVETELARSTARAAMWAADQDPTELPLAASLARLVCSQAALLTARGNVQVHGGIGFTWEHPAHLYLKRAKSAQLLLDGPAAQSARLGDAIGLPVGG